MGKCGCGRSDGLAEAGDAVVVLVDEGGEGDGEAKVEDGESCGFGWTGPRERRDCAKTGSAASRLMAG